MWKDTGCLRHLVAQSFFSWRQRKQEMYMDGNLGVKRMERAIYLARWIHLPLSTYCPVAL